MFLVQVVLILALADGATQPHLVTVNLAVAVGVAGTGGEGAREGGEHNGRWRG